MMMSACCCVGSGGKNPQTAEMEIELSAWRLGTHELHKPKTTAPFVGLGLFHSLFVLFRAAYFLETGEFSFFIPCVSFLTLSMCVCVCVCVYVLYIFIHFATESPRPRSRSPSPAKANNNSLKLDQKTIAHIGKDLERYVNENRLRSVLSKVRDPALSPL